MVDQQKAFSLISSRDQCQWSSPSRISDTPRAGFQPAQNLSLGYVEWSCAVVFFLLSGFSFMDTDNSQDSGGRGGDHLLFHSTTFTRSRTFRHLFATFHVRWLSHIFNRNACIYQTATRWDLPPYRITIWLIDDVILIFVYLIVGLILGFATAIWHEKPVDSNSHRLSSLYYEQTD